MPHNMPNNKKKIMYDNAFLRKNWESSSIPYIFSLKAEKDCIPYCGLTLSLVKFQWVPNEGHQ
jgi:hypothetical protein